MPVAYQLHGTPMPLPQQFYGIAIYDYSNIQEYSDLLVCKDLTSYYSFVVLSSNILSYTVTYNYIALRLHMRTLLFPGLSDPGPSASQIGVGGNPTAVAKGKVVPLAKRTAAAAQEAIES